MFLSYNRNCEERLKEFVSRGYKAKILPLPVSFQAFIFILYTSFQLPFCLCISHRVFCLMLIQGDVDFICGGPPCQGISGFNRFRNKDDPLKDPKNHQLVVFMDIVEYLKPRYILMENVVDIAKFAGGVLVCYAIGRLISMNYQARLGIMAAGSYGVPQCRLRVFLWGANSMEASFC